MQKAKEILKFIVINGVNVVAVIVYGIYLLIQLFHNTISNLFLKLPRYAKITIMYILVIGCISSMFTYSKNFRIGKIKKNSTSIEEISMALKTEEKKESVISPKETSKKNKKSNCKLNSIECKIYNEGIKQGMTKKQALISVAISKHETGRWTSSAYKNKNNYGGMMTSKGLKVFDNKKDGLKAFIKLLKNNYFNKGYTTIEKIQKKYAPLKAANDPKNLNSNWIRVVKQFYNEYAKQM